jgi:hypothetical protein
MDYGTNYYKNVYLNDDTKKIKNKYTSVINY